MTSSDFRLKRVVVTGLGAITPLGNTLVEYWEGLLGGRNGIGPITLFDASRHDCQIAGEVKGFDPQEYMDRKEAKRMDRFAQFAVSASKQALADANFEIKIALEALLRDLENWQNYFYHPNGNELWRDEINTACGQWSNHILKLSGLLKTGPPADRTGQT